MDKEDVILLGAGASAPEGAPLQAELFKECFKYQRANPVGSRLAMDERLSEFFMTFFGIDTMNDDLDTVCFPTFEEAPGMIDMAINRLESFKNYGADPVISTFQINVDLVLLLAGDAELLREHLRGLPHYHPRDGVEERLPNRVGHLAVLEPLPPAGGLQYVGTVAHALGAAGQRDVVLAAHDSHGRRCNSLHPRRALPGKSERGGLERYARPQRDDSGQVGLVASLYAAAQDDVPEFGLIDPRPPRYYSFQGRRATGTAERPAEAAALRKHG